MKKLAFILTAAVTIFSATAFASGSEKVSSHIKEAFQKNFLSAQNVEWRKVKDFYFASFKMNGSDVEAAYDEQGELLAMSREVKTTDLPLSISMELAEKYADYTITQKALEINFDGTTAYYLTASNEKRILKLKCYSNGDISVEKKFKKKA